MTARARKTTPTSQIPAAKKAPATTAAKVTPVATAKPARLDLAAMVGGAKQVTALPPKTSRTGGTPGGAFAPLIKRSIDEGIVLALPAVPDAHAVTTLRNALRRAASAQGLGVSIRPETTDEGIVVHFQAKAKK